MKKLKLKYIKLYEKFGYKKIIDYNQKRLPNAVLLNGEIYVGKTAFINGYNGYNTSEDDSLLCALINHSAWGKNKKPNLLTDEFGNLIHSTDRRGEIITFD